MKNSKYHLLHWPHQTIKIKNPQSNYYQVLMAKHNIKT